MFCPKCGGMAIPKKRKISCSCGYEGSTEGKSKLSQKNESKEKEIVVADIEFNADAITKDESCPKCGHEEATYTLVQTRSADEPPTKFLKCRKCKHTWRDYS